MKRMNCAQFKAELAGIKESESELKIRIAELSRGNIGEAMRLAKKIRLKFEDLHEVLGSIPKAENYTCEIVADVVLNEERPPSRFNVLKEIKRLAPTDGIDVGKLRIEHELVDKNGKLIGLFVAISLENLKEMLMGIKNDWYIYKTKHSS